MDVNTGLYRDFPLEITTAYASVVQVTNPVKRHGLVRQLAETALLYLASLAVSDYRSRQEPSSSVESLLEHLPPGEIAMESALHLLRASAGAVSESLFPNKPPLTSRQLSAAGLLSAAKAAIIDATQTQQPSDTTVNLNVELIVSQRLTEPIPRLTWWQAWDELVAYRNCVIHPAACNWPLYSDRDYDVFTPLFEAAVIEVLTYPPVATAVLDHPIANITLMVDNGDGTTMHKLCGEERGTWFEREIIRSTKITDAWEDDSWRATVASKYVIERLEGDHYDVRALYWDLQQGAPPCLKPQLLNGRVTAGGPPPMRLAKSSRPLEGRGLAPGTCGEFAQGPLPSGEEFHVTCPINKSTTVIAELRSDSGYQVTGLEPYQTKLDLAIRYTCEHLGIDDVAVHAKSWSNIDIAKGMGSSTADVLAGIRAIASAVGEQLPPEVEGEACDRCRVVGWDYVPRHRRCKSEDRCRAPSVVVVPGVRDRNARASGERFDRGDSIRW